MFVRLARILVSRQIASFKFDLSGMGDSSGSHGDATWEQWQEDTKTAAESLMEDSGTQNLVILGARAGALLAAQVAIELKAKRIILAEPIVSGEDFLRDLERRQAIKDMAAGIANQTEDAKTRWSKGETVDFAGFTFNAKLAESISNIKLGELVEQLKAVNCVVKGIRVSASKKLPPAWAPFADDTVVVADKPFWGQLDYYESDFVNNAIIEAL
jgi:alpha/beta superfamily hydrolase